MSPQRGENVQVEIPKREKRVVERERGAARDARCAGGRRDAQETQKTQATSENEKRGVCTHVEVSENAAVRGGKRATWRRCGARVCAVGPRAPSHITTERT